MACEGNERSEYIEPLTGIARHPFSKVGCKLPSEVDIFNIRHLVLANKCEPRAEESHASRNLLYYLGCSTFAKIPLCELHPKHRRCISGKVPPPSPTAAPPPPSSTSEAPAGMAHGPSLPLFMELYQRNCITFDKIYAWEAVKYPPALWWRDVPNATRAKLEFYNVPINETSTDEDVSFLRKLKATAREEDFVAVKVDIGGGPELAIVEAIAERPELAKLVDEIFFEYHFWFDGLVGPGWLMRRPGEKHRKNRFAIQTNATVDDALALMRKLRNRGIRSHFWV